MIDLDKVEWVNPEVKRMYKLFNRAYTTVIKREHPYVTEIYIEPNSFNSVFISDKWIIDVDVIVCADWSSRFFDTSKIELGGLGSDMVQVFSSVKNFFEQDEVIKSKYLSVNMLLNHEKYCSDKLTSRIFYK